MATVKPRASIARARRSRSGRSSSTIRRVFSSAVAISGAYKPPNGTSSILLNPDGGRFAVDHATQPDDADARSARFWVDHIHVSAGLFQQGFGDKKAQSHAFVLTQFRAGADFAFAQSVMAGP